MDNRNKTHKKIQTYNDCSIVDVSCNTVHLPITEKNNIQYACSNVSDTLRTLLDDSAKEAYSRPWHRLERGLRLNRIRIFIESISQLHSLSNDEKEALFLFLQKTHDKKLLNTTKIVIYNPESQKIELIRGLDIRRQPDNTVKWGFSVKKMKLETTRRRRRVDTLQPDIGLNISNNIVAT